MKRVALVLVTACGASEPPLEKLGSADLEMRPRMPKPGELSPLWDRIFVDDAHWTFGATECRTGYVMQVFGGWQTQFSCTSPALQAVLVGDRDTLWFYDREVDDIRKLPRGSAVNMRHVRDEGCFTALQEGQWITLCLREHVGVIGGSATFSADGEQKTATFGVVPRSW
jgi:hypothetical protein